MDQDMMGSSSPDPLNDNSFVFRTQTPQKPRHQSRFSLPLQGSSPKKQTFELDVGNDISPQKIRVTVEAGSSDSEGVYPRYNRDISPSRSSARPARRRERTTTTTVPVKGLDDSEPSNAIATTPRRRGRPRKSGTPIRKRGRAGTPKATGKSRTAGYLVDEDDMGIHTNESGEVGREKARSRSRSTKRPSRKSAGAGTPAATLDSLNLSGQKVKRRPGRPRKSILPEEPLVREHRSRLNSAATSSNQGSEPNEMRSPSDFSTIRSTAIQGGLEPDIVIARFDPGNETPRRTGWSSPRVIEAPANLVPRSGTLGDPSPTALSGSQRDYDDEDMELEPHSPLSNGDSRANGYEEDNFEEEHEQHHFLGNDTIMESEGFSMISVDSVPSLRHLSTPALPTETVSSKPVRNRSLLSVHEEVEDDSFSALPVEVLESAAPGPLPKNQNLRPIQKSFMDDIFSSIPPEVLKAATPAIKTQVSRLLTQNRSLLEDSFSSIPAEILAAATPARPQPNGDNSARSRKSENSSASDGLSSVAEQLSRRPSNALSIPESRSRPPSSSGQAIPSPDSRLPTPEETPSPGDDLSNQPSEIKEMTIVAEPVQTVEPPANDSTLMHSQMASSPPYIAPRRYTYTAHLREKRQLNPDTAQTPSIMFSSPTLPPPIHPQQAQTSIAPSLQLGPRPPLSPIARTGQALQNIRVPSSSRSRSQSLGSPFRSPSADRRSESGIPKEPTPHAPELARRMGSLPRLDLNEQLSGYSSQVFQESGSVHTDDPFGNNGERGRRSPSPEEKEQYTLGLPNSHRFSDSQPAKATSQINSVRSLEAMSWQPEEEILAPGSAYSRPSAVRSSAKNVSQKDHRVSSPQMTWEERAAAARAAVTKQISEANTSKVIAIGSDHSSHEQEEEEEQAEVEVEEDDEEFDLLLETLNSSSPAPQEHKEPTRAFVEQPRRSKIPSPWRQNSKRLVYSDELSRMSTPPVAENFAPAQVPKETRSSAPIIARRVVPEPTADDSIDLSGWQIPQKSGFKPRARETSRADISALLAMSPEKIPPVLPKESQRHSFEPALRSSRSLSVETTSKVATTTTNSIPRDQRGFTPIPQKAVFEPRPRANSPEKLPLIPRIFGGNPRNDIQQSIPELHSSSSVSRPLTNSSPSKANTLAARLKYLKDNTPDASSPYSAVQGNDSPSTSFTEEEQENRITNERIQKWTETLHKSAHPIQTPLPKKLEMSTPKSCLRSPIKPQFGAGTRATNPRISSLLANASPSKGVVFASSSPLPSPQSEPLSSTEWSRDHWVLLKSILKTWEPEAGKEVGDVGGRNSMRVVSKLLGRVVFNGGDRMKLEQWHLEVVDEFRSYVPGWEEKDIAMRVFALIVGAQQRADGRYVSSNSAREGERHKARA